MIIQWKWIQGSISDTQSAWRSIDKVHNIVQESETKTIPKKKKFKKAQWLSEEALQIAEERREVKGKGERERKSEKPVDILVFFDWNGLFSV